MNRSDLLYDDVTYIRTCGLSDAYLSRTLSQKRMTHISANAIRNARIGISWSDHPTPPDTRSRRTHHTAAMIGALVKPLTDGQINAALNFWARQTCKGECDVDTYQAHR